MTEKKMVFNKSKNFCDISPACYKISTEKEIIKRKIRDKLGRESFAGEIRKDKLPVVISSHSSTVIKKGKGIDPVLQENKAVNIILASSKISGVVINPGEVFSFWHLVGKITAAKGYKDGRVIMQNKIIAGMGGGLCNLSNTINLLILHSPLDIIEFHKHSDALAPDAGERVPLSAGTSVSYNYIDYRFKNNTGYKFQLFVWCDDGKLFGELRSEKEAEYSYRITEDDHHFEQEDGKYYRISKIYKETLEKDTEKIIERKLIWDNHSEVMFDYDMIPETLIRK